MRHVQRESRRESMRIQGGLQGRSIKQAKTRVSIAYTIYFPRQRYKMATTKSQRITEYLGKPRYLAVHSASLVFFGWVSGCAQAPSLAEPPIAYAWPTVQCPSDLGIHGYSSPLGGALASVAFGEVSSALFGVPSLLLSQAAKADQAG